MDALKLAGFAVALFAALVVLMRWKRRRDSQVRLNRGLTTYVASEPPAPAQTEADASVQIEA